MELNWPLVVNKLWPPLQNHVGPCVVGLAYSQRLSEECPSFDEQTIFESHRVEVRLISGCLIMLCGRWVFLTAGHQIKRLQESEDLGYTLSRFEIWCGSHTGDKVAVSLEDINSEYLRSEQVGELPADQDLGIVPVPTKSVQALQDAGAATIPNSLFADRHETFDGYCVIGVPEERFKVAAQVDSKHRRDITLHIDQCMLPVRELTGPDIPEIYRSGDPFVGQVLSLHGKSRGKAQELQSIAGMSGSPIFGFRLAQHELEIGFVGVQSRWIKSSRTIAGTRVEL